MIEVRRQTVASSEQQVGQTEDQTLTPARPNHCPAVETSVAVAININR